MGTFKMTKRYWKPTGERIEILQTEYDEHNFVYLYKARFANGTEDWIPADEVEDTTDKLNALTVRKSNWREKVKQRQMIDELNEWFDSLSDDELSMYCDESIVGMPNESQIDDWFEKNRKDDSNCNHICTNCEATGCAWHEEIKWLQLQQYLKLIEKMKADKQKVQQMFKEGKTIEEIEASGIKFTSNTDNDVSSI